MQSFDFKKLLPHALIIGLFALISLLFCYPALQGKELIQSDIISWKAAAHEGMEWHEKTGENVMWSNSMFGGMPTYTFYVAKTKNYFRYVQMAVTETLSKPAYFFFLAMVSFYILMCTLRVNRWLGFAGAIAFAFSTYNALLIVTGHESKILTIAYMPLVISAMLVTYRGRYLLGGIFLSISFALLIVASHVQIIYYMAIIIGLAVIGFFVQALKEQQLKRFFIASCVCLLAFALGIGPGMSNLLTVQEYSKVTMRGGQSELTLNHDPNKPKTGGLDKDYAFQWSNGIGETFCILIPYLYGGSGNEPLEKAPQAGDILAGAGYNAVPLYWGPQPFLAGPVYFGAIICFLFVLGLFVVRSPHKWWILAACVIGVVMSWGKNFPALNYFLFDHLPFYNKFRTPSMILVIPQFLFPVLGIWGVMEIINGGMVKEELLKKLKIALGITVGLCLLIGFGGGMFFDYTNPTENQYPRHLLDALIEDRKELAMESSLRSAFFILLSGGLLWAFVKEKIKMNVLVAGIGLLIAIDLIPVAHNYLNEDNYQEETDYETVFQPRPVDRQIMQDTTYYRVLDLSRDTYNDAVQSYFHKTIGGYSPAKMEVYQDLIDIHMNRQAGKFNFQVLNMLNTKYIIFPDAKGNPMMQMNPEACGNAWFVDEVKWVKTADEEMLSLNAPSLGDTAQISNAFDPKKTAVVRETYKNELSGYSFGKDSNARIWLTKYGLNHIYYESNNSMNGFGVFSEIYYDKGWEAYIDGKQVPILKVNYLLRALKIPAGHHKIEFHFRPKTYEVGENISMITSLLLYGLGITAIIILLRRKDPEPTGKK